MKGDPDNKTQMQTFHEKDNLDANTQKRRTNSLHAEQQQKLLIQKLFRLLQMEKYEPRERTES
jgi:hypothetical protein